MAYRNGLVASDGDPPMEAGKHITMYYAYVLLSNKDNNLYIGKTDNLKRRIEQHHAGLVKATKGRRPFELIYYEGFVNKSDCHNEELFLKSGIGRESLAHRLKNTHK